MTASAFERAARCAFALCAGFTAALLGACSSTPSVPSIDREPGAGPAAQAPRAPAPPAAATTPRPGAYYKDDGPGDSPPLNLDRIADAEPRVEALQRSSNNPYSVFGASYTPMRALAPFRESGTGSWYGRRFHGLPTSSGEPYDMYAMTAAHPTLPIPSYARVTNSRNNRSVIVRINDRGPFHSGRIIDLSFAAAYKLGYAEVGSAPVEVELLLPEEIARLSKGRAGASEERASALEERANVSEDRSAAAAPPRAGAGAPAVVPVALTVPVAAGRAAPNPAQSVAAQVYLQLGAFTQRGNAESMRDRARREAPWLNEPIEVAESGGTFRVQVGPYPDRGAAAATAERIQQTLQLKPLLVTRR